MTYLTFLCYRGVCGSVVAPNQDTALSDALGTIESLTRFVAGESIAESLYELEDAFTNPSFCREDIIDAFHMFLEEMWYSFENRDLFCFTEMTYSGCPSLYWLLESLPTEQKESVLDLHPEFIPFFYSFDAFQHYVMLERNPVRRSFFVLRKEIEGARWNHVDILGDFPQGESFDCIVTCSVPFTVKEGGRRVSSNYDSRYLISALQSVRLKENAQVLRGIETKALIENSFQKHLSSLDGFYLDKVFEIGYPRKFKTMNPVVILKKGSTNDSPVTFIFIPQVEFEREYKGDRLAERIFSACQPKEGPQTTLVPRNEIRIGTLSPNFYLTRRMTQIKGRISLSDISLPDGIEKWERSVLNQKEEFLTVRSFENNPGLVALTPHKDRKLGSGYLLKKSAILLYSVDGSLQHGRSPRHTFASRIEVGQGSSVLIPHFMIPVVIDQDRFDLRFVQMTILQQIEDFEKLGRYFEKDSAAILDILYIPDIPIEEQRKAVEDYLQTFKNSLPASAKNDGPKAATYNILVITPDRESFEERFCGKMKEEYLNVIDFASDSKSLSEVLPKHFGKDVPASQRVDAILTDVSAPVGDTNFVLMKIHDLDVRKFYYSTGGYSRGCIYDIFWDTVESGLVEGDEPASGIRRALDTQMSPEARLREEYREFFRSADRLDSLHPGWDLSGTVMKYLLDGRTKTPVNTVRSRLSETLCRFFRDCRAVPFCMEDGAIPSFLADGRYKDGKRNLEYKVDDKVDDKRQESEAWVRYAFVALFKLGNKESHVSKDTEEMVSEAALIILMQVIRWFEGVHDRYAEGGVGFKCFRGDKECRLQTVREVAPGYFSVGDVHVGRQEGLRDGSVGMLNDHLPREKNPRTIDGATYTRYAGKDSFHILLQ